MFEAGKKYKHKNSDGIYYCEYVKSTGSAWMISCQGVNYIAYDSLAYEEVKPKVKVKVRLYERPDGSYVGDAVSLDTKFINFCYPNYKYTEIETEIESP